MKYKFLLLLLILFLVPNVYASDYRLNSHISATSGGTKNRYGGLENYNYGSYGTYTFGTRYQGRLGNIETYIDYPFEANTTYTLTYNMNTDDFINHFGSSYWWDCSQTMTNSNATVQSVNYISYKKIKFTFTPSSNTTCIYVSIRSTNPNSSSITQITNWQLDSIYLYDPDYQSGSSGGGSSPTPTPTADSNQDIIDNANQNTTDIINNNNENTQKIIDSMEDCLVNIFNPLIYTGSNFTTTEVTRTGITATATQTWKTISYSFNVEQGERYTIHYKSETTGAIMYRSSGNNWVQINNGSFFTFVPDSDTIDIRLQNSSLGTGSYNWDELMLIKGSVATFIPYGSPQCSNKIDKTTDSINNLNDSINNDNVDSGVGSGFFDDFESEDFGLSSIITIPLNTIQNLTSQSCVALNVPIPFTNSTVPLPCMTQVYEQNIPTIYNLWKIVSFGIIAYFIAIDIFHMVKGFKDPESDKVEVLDL